MRRRERMKTLNHSWLWTEPRVSPCSRIAPAFSGMPPRKHMSNWPTQTRAFGLTEDPLLLPSSNDCHELLAGAAKGQQRLERHCFFVLFLFFNFFSSEGIGGRRKAVMYTRFSLSHIYGIKWIAKRKTKFDAHTALGQRFFWDITWRSSPVFAI